MTYNKISYDENKNLISTSTIYLRSTNAYTELLNKAGALAEERVLSNVHFYSQ